MHVPCTSCHAHAVSESGEGGRAAIFPARAKPRALSPHELPVSQSIQQPHAQTCFHWVKTTVLTSMDTAAQSVPMCHRASSTCPRTSFWRSCTGWMASLSPASGGQRSQYTQPHHIFRRSSSHRAGGSSSSEAPRPAGQGEIPSSRLRRVVATMRAWSTRP